MINGYGTFYYLNGIIYEGEFKLDHKDGPGILTKQDGTII